MIENKWIPKRRFKEFENDGDWEQLRLKDIAEFNPKSTLPDEFEYVDLESVVGTDLIAHRTESKASAPSRAQRLAKRGDVFYQTVRPYQKNNYLYDLPYDNYVFSTGYAQMRPSIDSYFLLSRVQEERFVKTVLDRSTGTSYPAINSNDLSEIEVKVPVDSGEQKKIGVLFRNLDFLRTLHQSKLNKLKELKLAYLSEMFPIEGEKYPRRRFAGFNEPWEQCKLGEIYKFQYGQFNTNPSNGGQYPVYGANGVIGGYTEFNAEDSVIIGHMGEYAGNVLWGNGKHFVTYNGIITMPRDNKVNSRFGYYMLQQKNIREICGGSGQPFLSYEMLDKLQSVFPVNIDEQKKISIFFSNLDNLITLHQRKLEKLENIKKAYLNEMFV